MTMVTSQRPGRGFLAAAGLEPAQDFLARYRVEPTPAP